jgi:AAA family ATP:ADP antiporter
MNLLSLSLMLSMGRAAKFTIFDTARDMSFLSLPQQEKRLGKAAVDGLTSRFGKTGGAWLVILIVGQTGQILASLVPLKTAIFIAYGLWFWAVITLIGHLPKDIQ